MVGVPDATRQRRIGAAQQGLGTTPGRPEHVQRAKGMFDTLQYQQSETAEMLRPALIYRQISARTARWIRLIPPDTREAISTGFWLPTFLPTYLRQQCRATPISRQLVSSQQSGYVSLTKEMGRLAKVPVWSGLEDADDYLEYGEPCCC